MRHPVTRPALAVIVTVALVLLLGLLPSATVPGVPVEVTGTRTLACPAGDPATLATTVRAGAADALTSRLVGQAQSTTASRTLVATAVAQPVVLTGGSSLGGVAQAAVSAGTSRGLWLAPCRAPSADLWFPGVLSNASERAVIELVNVDPTQAVVDVTVLGKDGRVTAPGARGVGVPGNSVRLVFLEPLFTSPDPVGLQVRTSEGRIAATVRLLGAAGGDWAAAATAPSTTAVVPVVPDGDGARTLVVTNPGTRRAAVTVEVFDRSSAFAPAGADTFEVNAESTLAVPLEGALRGALVGLRLTSTQPVAAAVRVAIAGDLALVEAGSPLASPARIPFVAEAQLIVTNAGTSAGVVTLTTRDAEGAVVDSSRTEVGAGRLMPLPLTGDRTASFELTSDNPDIRGALLVTRSGTVPGVAVAVLGGGGTGTASLDPSLDPALAR